MFATIRRYESVDQSRTAELVKKVDDTLLPRLSKLPGFGGYHLIKAGDGIMSSDRLLRHFGAGRRVDQARVQLGARGEAREGAAERAEDHDR